MTNTDLRDALRRAASALKAHGAGVRAGRQLRAMGVRRAGAGARRGFRRRSGRLEAAALTLEKAGFRIDRTPEDWLFKACVGGSSSSMCCISSTGSRWTRT